MSKIQSESNSQRQSEHYPNWYCCDRYVKDTIWKQFTTQGYITVQMNWLWSVCQRYNLKAIHNGQATKVRSVTVVIGMSKIQSESNSQHGYSINNYNSCCDRYVKDTIWKQFTTALGDVLHYTRLWSVCQRYNLKAIHNPLALRTRSTLVVIGMSKIQSESNSQQHVATFFTIQGCDRYVKDTIWKQFTTLIR